MAVRCGQLQTQVKGEYRIRDENYIRRAAGYRRGDNVTNTDVEENKACRRRWKVLLERMEKDRISNELMEIEQRVEYLGRPRKRCKVQE